MRLNLTAARAERAANARKSRWANRNSQASK